jgi:SAM-dependent methyltransferase
VKGNRSLGVIESILGSIDGGKVLDVATKEGHFVHLLMENLASYKEIEGIDIDKDALDKARSKFGRENITFLTMDAERLDFEAEGFDTVNISASLHHLADIQQVLEEMKRVLKPGGTFLIEEIHRDGQTEAALTSVCLHQWVAEVDSALGELHHATLRRQEIVDHSAHLGLSRVEFHDIGDTDSDPWEKARIEQLDSLIERTLRRIKQTSNLTGLWERGEALRQRLYDVGAQREPILVIVGRK